MYSKTKVHTYSKYWNLLYLCIYAFYTTMLGKNLEMAVKMHNHNFPEEIILLVLYLSTTVNLPSYILGSQSIPHRYVHFNKIWSYTRLIHERILGILAAQPGPNGQLSCLHSFKNLLTHETIIYLKLNVRICSTF